MCMCVHAHSSPSRQMLLPSIFQISKNLRSHPSPLRQRSGCGPRVPPTVHSAPALTLQTGLCSNVVPEQVEQDTTPNSTFPYVRFCPEETGKCRRHRCMQTTAMAEWNRLGARLHIHVHPHACTACVRRHAVHFRRPPFPSPITRKPCQHHVHDPLQGFSTVRVCIDYRVCVCFIQRRGHSCVYLARISLHVPLSGFLTGPDALPHEPCGVSPHLCAQMRPYCRPDHAFIILWPRKGYRQNLNPLWHFLPQEDVRMVLERHWGQQDDTDFSGGWR